MPTTNLKGHVIPAGGDPANAPDTFQAFSNSLSDLAPASSETQANQIATTSGKYPVHVWRTDLHAHMVKETSGGAWMQSGGQDFYAEANIARTAPNNATTELHVDSFGRRSEGWALSGGGIVIPQTGVWSLDIYGNFEDITSATTGRRYFSLKVNSNVHNQKMPIVDDTSGGGSTTQYLTKGNVVMFMVRNETGASRVVRADITLAYIGLPRLV